MSTLSTLAPDWNVTETIRWMFDTAFDIAQAVFGSLSHLWTDHRLSRETKLRLYKLSVCSSLTHCCTASALTRTVTRMSNGFNSRCLHVIAGKEYRVTATTPVYEPVSCNGARLTYDRSAEIF